MFQGIRDSCSCMKSSVNKLTSNTYSFSLCDFVSSQVYKTPIAFPQHKTNEYSYLMHWLGKRIDSMPNTIPKDRVLHCATHVNWNKILSVCAKCFVNRETVLCNRSVRGSRSGDCCPEEWQPFPSVVAHCKKQGSMLEECISCVCRINISNEYLLAIPDAGMIVIKAYRAAWERSAALPSIGEVPLGWPI